MFITQPQALPYFHLPPSALSSKSFSRKPVLFQLSLLCFRGIFALPSGSLAARDA